MVITSVKCNYSTSHSWRLEINLVDKFQNPSSETLTDPTPLVRTESPNTSRWVTMTDNNLFIGVPRRQNSIALPLAGRGWGRV